MRLPRPIAALLCSVLTLGATTVVQQTIAQSDLEKLLGNPRPGTAKQLPLTQPDEEIMSRRVHAELGATRVNQAELTVPTRTAPVPDAFVSWFVEPASATRTKADVYRVLKIFAETRLEYVRLKITAIREAHSQPVRLEYTKAMIDKINWKTATPDGIYSLAVSSQIDPSFR